MTWYTACYGNWRSPEGVKYIEGEFSRKEIFAKAREVANKERKAVMVIEQRTTYKGLAHRTFTVTPE